MISTIYTKILHDKHRHSVQEFCNTFAEEGIWIQDDIYRIDVDESNRIQYKLSLSSFQADLGSNVCAVCGVKDDPLMGVAIDCASRYALGKLVDLSDVLLLCIWNQDTSLMEALSNKLKGVSPEIIDTLKMYFNTGNNALLASELLYLHRNTFNYRLNKFVDKTDMDIKNAHIAQFLYQYFTLMDRVL